MMRLPHGDLPSPHWNRTERAHPADRLVHDLFSDRVGERPDAIAVVCADITLTYRQLDDRANALARLLRHRYGVGRDVLVALVLDRSERVLISMLAVLKAGGAYVPLAPESPDQRLGLVLAEAKPRVVLTDDGYQTRLGAIVRDTGTMADVLSVVSATSAGLPADDERLAQDAKPGPDALAYVIYTSGTSGRPKGVMIEHRSVVNYIHNTGHRLGLSAADICDYSTSISFDLTITTTLAIP